MAVSFRVTGIWAELTADGAVTIPSTPQAGDRMYLFARWKTFSITATVAGWTKLPEFADGSAASGNGTGSVKVACWYRNWQSGDSNPTIDFSANPTTASAVIMVMAKSAGDDWLAPLVATAAMTNWTTTSQTVAASATVAVPSGGVVMGLIGIRDDSATMTRPTNGIDDSGSLITWNGNYVESPATHHSTTTGDDGAADLGYRLVTTGATATLRMTGTLSAAETGAALWVVQGTALAFPATGILDNFNRANGALGANWGGNLFAGDNNLVIDSNQAKPGAEPANNGWATQFGPDCEVYVDITTYSSHTNIVARWSVLGGSPSGYMVAAHGDVSLIKVYRFTGGSFTELITFAQVVESGDSLGMRVSGSTIYVYYKDVSVSSDWYAVGQVIDATHSGAGYIGLYQVHPTTFTDNFGGGTFPPSAGNGKPWGYYARQMNA